MGVDKNIKITGENRLNTIEEDGKSQEKGELFNLGMYTCTC